MATATLPGFVRIDPTKYVLTPGVPTYSQLVSDTLGNAGLPGDDIEKGIAALQAAHDSFFADVDAQIAEFPLPDPTRPPLNIGPLILLEAEVAVQSATEVAIGGALDYLAGAFGVWGILDDLVKAIQAALYALAAWVLSLFYAINNQLNFINPGQFGGL